MIKTLFLCAGLAIGLSGCFETALFIPNLVTIGLEAGGAVAQYAPEAEPEPEPACTLGCGWEAAVESLGPRSAPNRSWAAGLD
jgi:hypothetical protein